MPATGREHPSERIAGSFRDPSGYVFRRDGRVFRAVGADCSATLHGLAEEGALENLVAEGALVASRFVDDPALLSELRAENGGFDSFLEHQALARITFPYEWSISMLADAAALTLDLEERLLARGLSLKDATAYNVQFVRGRPVFIDLASIERPRRLDVWFALGQFNQMFLFPLFLCVHRGWDLRSYFLGRLNGRSVEEMGRGLGSLEKLRPRSLLDVTLPLWLSRAAERKPSRGAETKTRQGPGDPRAQVLNLHRLRGKALKLAARYKPGGVWSTYTRRCSYDESSEKSKKELVRAFLEEHRPATVLDLGCNTGDYSLLAAGCGASVTAADADHDAVELLYRRLRAEPADITPMVVDLGNPSPAIGFLNAERPAALERMEADCVLALALIHHLFVAGNLPFASIRDLFARLCRRFLLLEFVPKEDSMFQRLTRFRVDLSEGYELSQAKRVFGEKFTLIREAAIPSSTRTLLVYQKAP
jgi:hypothetical protein